LGQILVNNGFINNRQLLIALRGQKGEEYYKPIESRFDILDL